MATKKQGSATVAGGGAEKTGASAATQPASAPSTAAASGTGAGSSAEAGGGPANVPAATDFEASGAPVQDTGQVDPSHPAVDNDPRAGTTRDQNRIDFNDPTISGSKAVEQNLKASD